MNNLTTTDDLEPRKNDEFMVKLINIIDSKFEPLENRLTAIEKNTSRNQRDITDIKEEMTLTPAEADELSLAVKRKGVEVMGGKRSNAYKNIEIRRAVYRDIYGEMKRQFGLINEKGAQLSYKKLRRKIFEGAVDEVERYIVSAALEEQITAENELDLED